MTNIIATLKKDSKTIAGDIVTVGATLTTILLIVSQAAPAVHLPDSAVAVIATVSTAITAIVTQARRVSVSKKAAKAD